MTAAPRKRNLVDRWVDQSSVPVFLVAADQSVAFFNHGCERLTGWSSSDLIGQTCQFSTNAPASSVDSVTGALCPPPETWKGQEVQLPAYVPVKHGAALPRLIHFFPLAGTHGKVAGVLGVITPLKPLPPAAAASPVLQLHADLAAIRAQLRSRYSQESLVTRSQAMNKVLNQLDLAMRTDVPVCLLGEPGTGREHLARMIHYGGALKSGWFVPVACDSLPVKELEQTLNRLIDIHLAGIAPGARPQPATLFLSEFQLIPRDVQERLAKSLASRPSAETRGLRMICSCSRPSSEFVTAGLLRSDLEGQLTTLVLAVPPLRERPEDLGPLAQHFLEEFNKRHARQLTGFAADIWPYFERHHWPGNLDELQRVVTSAANSAADTTIKVSDLPFQFRIALQGNDSPPPAPPRTLPLDDMLQRVELQAIQLALERCHYNKSKAAEMLGINRARLYRRMEQLGIADLENTSGEVPSGGETS